MWEKSWVYRQIQKAKGANMSALFHEVTEQLSYELRRHGRQIAEVDAVVNTMTQYEFLQAISEALDIVLRKRNENS